MPRARIHVNRARILAMDACRAVVDNGEGGKEEAMLGDIVELSVVVRDLDAAVERYTRLFGLAVHHRGESKEFGFKNAILPTGIGHIELLQPTDPAKPAGRFLARHGEGVYLVGFECKDIPAAAGHLKKEGARVDHRREDIAWVHPQDAHGLFVELRKRESYA
ncbi:MAG: hypothetical protein C5B48_03315 [Candidatus Rokuibacteriota bacterium]|nr:MAG: hypothetical protein C5B48_03315 [Candidatus Rokubacteria bacterium]